MLETGSHAEPAGDPKHSLMEALRFFFLSKPLCVYLSLNSAFICNTKTI